MHSSHETLLHDEEALVKAAIQVATQTRHEIFLTEQTAVVSPEELGWLGIVTAGRHGRRFNPLAYSSSSTSAPIIRDHPEMILLKCSRCNRMVIPARHEVHRQNCIMAMSLSNRHGQTQSSQPTSGNRFPAMLGGALGHNPSIRRGVGSSSGGSGGSEGGVLTKSQHGKKNGSNRSLPASDPICAIPDVPTWDAPLPPLPKARTNLSKVSYPYQPESGSLLDDFMESIIDRFVFPHHLKKSRAAGPKRSEFYIFASWMYILEQR